MALEGNLSDFSLADMFRLLHTGHKSGVLHVSTNGRDAVVCFRDGLVYYANGSGESEQAGARLASAGIVSEKQLRQAKGLMKIQRRDKAGRKLGQILIDEGYVDAPRIEAYLRGVVAEALFDLLRLEEGDLRFEPDEVMESADLGITVAVDDALAEANKRYDAWTRIREKIPTLETRFAMSSGPASKTIEIHLKPREWMLLCHLHGSRSVAEMVELTGYSDFEVSRILYGMYAGGLIEKVGPAGEQLFEAR